MPVFQYHSKLRVWECLGHFSFDTTRVLFRHACPFAGLRFGSFRTQTATARSEPVAACHPAECWINSVVRHHLLNLRLPCGSRRRLPLLATRVAWPRSRSNYVL